MSDAINWLAGWYNWPFLLPLCVGVLFILIDLVMGGVSDLFGLDADADVDLHTHVHTDLDMVDGVAHQVGVVALSMTWLGLGKVPISVLLEMLTISFGVTGLLVNGIGADVLGSSVWVFPLALVAACVVAPLTTKALGGLVARMVPADATTSRKPSDFVGELAITASTVSHRVGQVRVAASGAHPQALLSARLDPNVADDLPRDVEVLLVAHDAERNLYVITPTSLES